MKGLPANIGDNLRFLLAEVKNQLDDLNRFLQSRNISRAQRILDRKGYAGNLMLRIQNACIHEINGASENAIPRLRSVQAIAADLNRITELARDVIQQISHTSGNGTFNPDGLVPLVEKVIRGVELIEKTVDENNTRLALKIGALERKIDREYSKLLGEYTRALKQKKHTEDLISALLAAHILECMGDVLLNISEALLASILGQPMEIDRYHSLMESLQRLADPPADENGIVIESIAETRSGSGISGISRSAGDKRPDPGYAAIFKGGARAKLKNEKDGVRNWHELYPGLAPRILSYKKRGESASLLIEHLAGMTFEQILIRESDDLLNEALARLAGTLASVWKETRNRKIAPAEFMKQLDRRISDVYVIHPEFGFGRRRICGYEVAPFEQLVRKAGRLEQGLAPPFSVYIHGDFNVDNIIYDPVERKINYIDLHRSRYSDYVQDISVFMVSNYRLQIMDAPVRRRILGVIIDFHRTVSGFAQKHDDQTFEVRLALGLARSFVTSTRFILDKTQAGGMFLKARYLLEQVVRLKPDDIHQYKIPVQELFSG